MKILQVLAATLVLGLAAGPALAQGAAGNGAVAGEGPGGSGAGQSSAGPSKSFLAHRGRMRRHKRRVM